MTNVLLEIEIPRILEFLNRDRNTQNSPKKNVLLVNQQTRVF